MDPYQYQQLASRTLLKNPGFSLSEREIMIAWNAIGLAGEAGEVAEHIKKSLFHKQELKASELKGELGDLLWYISSLCTLYGFDLSSVMDANIEKLKLRYPDGFVFGGQENGEGAEVKVDGRR